MENIVGKNCPYCQTPIKESDNVVFCSNCNMPHHASCWNENKGCTTFGCEGFPTRSISNPQTAAGYVNIDIGSEDNIAATLNTKTCPFCGETIQSAAIKCRYCQSMLNQQEALYNGSVPLRNSNERLYTKASLWNRFWAYFLDGLIVSATFLPMAIVSEIDQSMTGYYYSGVSPFWYLITFPICIWGIYYIFTRDGRPNGQSIGKKVAGIMVISLDNGQPITKGKSAIRQLIWIICYIPFIGWILSLVECVLVLADDRGRRIGDRLANTQVIMKNDYLRNY